MHLSFRKYREDLPSSTKLPKLDFTYEEVSSTMIPEMLDFHYRELHQGYIDRYNAAQSKMNLSFVQRHPEDEKEKDLLFNLGGFLNHSLFWKSFTPKKEEHVPSERLQTLIKKSFQKDLCEEMVEMIPRIRGSGWIWLIYCRKTDMLRLTITMGQDFPEEPALLNLDLWEHSFLQQYKKDKKGYVISVFKIFNWKHASERLERILNE